jgi:hypothetical protein
MMKDYNTLVEALQDLNARGYSDDFELQTSCIHCKTKKLSLKPDEFEIVEVYRFEGMSDPDDNAVVYALEAADGTKGVIVDAYGTYAQNLDFELAEKLRRAKG